MQARKSHDIIFRHFDFIFLSPFGFDDHIIILCAYIYIINESVWLQSLWYYMRLRGGGGCMKESFSVLRISRNFVQHFSLKPVSLYYWLQPGKCLLFYLFQWEKSSALFSAFGLCFSSFPLLEYLSSMLGRYNLGYCNFWNIWNIGRNWVKVNCFKAWGNFIWLDNYLC